MITLIGIVVAAIVSGFIFYNAGHTNGYNLAVSYYRKTSAVEKKVTVKSETPAPAPVKVKAVKAAPKAKVAVASAKKSAKATKKTTKKAAKKSK